MKYLDIINNCKLRIDNEFKEFALSLETIEPFSKLHPYLTSNSFVNEFQLVDIILSYYVPGIKDSDEDGIDISIRLSQIRKTENEITTYTSKIRYDKNDDLILEKILYVSSDICTTTGIYILDNTDYEISTHDLYTFEKELSKAIDSIFLSFKSNVNLMSSKLLDIKNCVPPGSSQPGNEGLA